MSDRSVVAIGEIQQPESLAQFLSGLGESIGEAIDLVTSDRTVDSLMAAQRLRLAGKLAAVVVGVADDEGRSMVADATADFAGHGVVVVTDEGPASTIGKLLSALMAVPARMESPVSDATDAPEERLTTTGDDTAEVNVAPIGPPLEPVAIEIVDAWADTTEPPRVEVVPVVDASDDADWDFGDIAAVAPSPPAQPVTPIDWDLDPTPAPPADHWADQQPAPQPPQPDRSDQPQDAPLWGGQPQPSALPAVRTPPAARFDATSLYAPERPPAAANGPKVVFVASGKGGVGKSTVALTLAWRAAAVGVPTCLIDANRGQGDLRLLLRLDPSALIKNVALAANGDPAAAIMSPDELANARHGRLAAPGFSFVAAPPRDLADPRIAGPDVYRAVTDLALRSGYFVVVDTQIAEAFDTTGLWDEFIIPALRDHRLASLVAVLDGSMPGIQNTGGLVDRVRQSDPAPRTFVIANRVSPATDTVAQHTISEWFGSVGAENTAICVVDQAIERATQLGVAAPSGSELAAAVDEILYRLTELPAFESHAHQSKWSLRGLFRR